MCVSHGKVKVVPGPAVGCIGWLDAGLPLLKAGIRNSDSINFCHDLGMSERQYPLVSCLAAVHRRCCGNEPVSLDAPTAASNVLWLAEIPVSCCCTAKGLPRPSWKLRLSSALLP